MTESMHRTLVVMKRPRVVPALLTLTRAILSAMANSPHFPSPTPSLAVLAAALAQLGHAQTAVLSRTRGTRETRDEKHAKLVTLLQQLERYVQSVADGNPDAAVSIIESAGMSVKRPAVQAKPPFAVKPGRVSGSVQLTVCSAGDRAAYYWQWSTDGGVEWRDAPATTQAKTAIAGLPVANMCWFRVRVVTKDGEQDWSQPLSNLVT
jgi:hypothetical protein